MVPWPVNQLKTRLKQEQREGLRRAYERFIRFIAQIVAAGQRQGLLREGHPRRFAVGLAGITNHLPRGWLQRRSRDSLAAIVADWFLYGAAKR